MPVDPVFIVAVLAANVVISEWLVRHTPLRHFGTALLVIVVTAVTSNIGLIPTTSAEAPLYDGVFSYVAPLAIFWLLLQVNLRDILRAGVPMIGMFIVGAVGTFLGVMIGMWAVDGPKLFGDAYRGLGGMFVGTYIGGSVNFNALALFYGVAKDGTLYAASTAGDNIMTALWMIATIALPRMLMPAWRRRSKTAQPSEPREVYTGADEDTETVHPIDLGLLVTLGAGAIWFSDWSSECLAAWSTQWLPQSDLGEPSELRIPPVLILTTLGIVLAQFRAVANLKGAKLLGMFAVYVFLAVIGAFCDLSALAGIGRLGYMLLAFIAIVVGIHGVLTFGIGMLFRVDPDIVAVASQANIGGGTSALALARSLGRPDLTVPAVLIGALGYALGTYLGFLAAGYLL